MAYSGFSQWKLLWVREKGSVKKCLLAEHICGPKLYYFTVPWFIVLSSHNHCVKGKTWVRNFYELLSVDKNLSRWEMILKRYYQSLINGFRYNLFDTKPDDVEKFSLVKEKLFWKLFLSNFKLALLLILTTREK